jgi:ubiquitin carboxyl-terminal hydrolase 34
MHMGEVINDCLCEECGVKGDFTKRSVLGDTPNVMIIHLQRIIFNLDVFMNTKIHTRLPFPL